MFKRMFLAIAFIAALSAGGLGMSSKAVAWHCDDDYGYGYRAAYYPSYYGYGGYGYAPRASYYRSYPVYYRNYGYDGHHHHHHDHDRSHVTFSFGF